MAKVKLHSVTADEVSQTVCARKKGGVRSNYRFDPYLCLIACNIVQQFPDTAPF